MHDKPLLAMATLSSKITCSGKRLHIIDERITSNNNNNGLCVRKGLFTTHELDWNVVHKLEFWTRTFQRQCSQPPNWPSTNRPSFADARDQWTRRVTGSTWTSQFSPVQFRFISCAVNKPRLILGVEFTVPYLSSTWWRANGRSTDSRMSSDGAQIIRQPLHS